RRAHAELESFPTRRSSDLLTWVGSTVMGAAGSPMACSIPTLEEHRPASSSFPEAHSVNSTRTELARPLDAARRTLPGSRSPFMRSEEHTSELQSRFDLVCR